MILGDVSNPKHPKSTENLATNEIFNSTRAHPCS